MIFDEDTQEFVLTTGTRFWAFDGRLSASPSGGLSFGSSGRAYVELSHPERVEVAQFIISEALNWVARGGE